MLRTAPEEVDEPEVLRTAPEEVVEPLPSPVRRTVWPELEEVDEPEVTLVAELVVPLLAAGVEVLEEVTLFCEEDELDAAGTAAAEEVLLAEVVALAEEAADVEEVDLAEEAAAVVDEEDVDEEVTRF